ncbi:MAG: chemotaxis protein CheA [Spirochaetes bacterium]|jgi:two-component system chemotaxis sensor kinase CheA|nr:chemotaxis protein CheA [Spirochaetota bacterium]
MSDYLDPQNEELLQDFFAEAEMQVEALESNVLVLENDPGNHDAIDEIFRAAHTLKGASATVQMDELSEFTHLIEDVLDRIRNDELAVDGSIVDTLLSSIDVIKAMLEARGNGEVYGGDTEPLKATLRQLLEAESGSSAGNESRPPAEPEARQPAAENAPSPESAPATERASSSAVAGLSEQEMAELRQAAEGSARVFRVRVHFDESNPMNSVGGIQVFAALKRSGSVLKTAPDFEELYEDNFFPIVDYYMASEEEPSDLESSAAISDVTTKVEVLSLDDDGGGTAPAASTEATEPSPVESTESVESEEKAPRASAAASQGTAEPAAAAPATGAPAGAEAEKAVEKAKGKQSGGSVLRVDSRRIDNLLNLVSETVINKAAFNQLATGFNEELSSLQLADDRYRELMRRLFDSLPEYLEKIREGVSPTAVKREIASEFGELYSVFDEFQSSFKGSVSRLRSTTQNLGRITGELQEAVMHIRMVPISQIFSRFPRLVRDLSRSLNKQVNLEIEGEDTELDKSVIEDLLDPLIHSARNSIDHGIETAAERVEAGKPEAGTLRLAASNEGNMIVITVEDDGRGIDVENIQRKAVERGVIPSGKTLSDVEAHNLIFDPGFSTAKEITNVSGRGVGLDVVKRQIEKVNGTVTVWSEKGAGTRFTIKIPLTLAIIQGLLVRVGRERYAIPITSVIESHRIRPSEIRLLDNYEVFNVREDVVSLIRLNRIFGIEADEEREYYFVVIVGTGEKKIGLLVDSLIGEEDVVIKPLRDHYTNAPGIAGANITGDGTVSLIIDVSQLLDLGMRHEMERRRRRETRIS